MKVPYFYVLLLSVCAFGQTLSAPSTQPAVPLAVPDTAVVAKVNGKPITAAEARKMISVAPPQVQQGAARDPKSVLEYLFLIDALQAEATKDKVTEASPWKDQIQFGYKQLLAQAEVAFRTNLFTVTEEEQKNRYEADKPVKYEQAKIRVIYISFVDPKAAPASADGKKYLTEAEAKAKAEDLAKQIRSGADFAALAKANSEDKNSAEKGGDFGWIRRSDKLNEDLKKAVFALKAGETGDPMRQPNGFYIIRVDEKGFRPYEEIKTEQFQEMRQEKFQQWLKVIQDQNKVTIENADFFKTGTAAR